MRCIFAFTFIFSSLVCAESAPPLVTSVTLRGTLLHVTLATQVGRPYDAGAIDRDVHQLWSTGRFGDIRVRTEQQPDGAGVIFDVVEAHRPAPPKPAAPENTHAQQVKVVNFIGEPGIDPKQLRRALRALNPHRIFPGIPGLWNGWRLYRDYTRAAVDADLARLRSLYLSKGYFDAAVRIDSTELREKDAAVTFFVRSGPHYETSPPIPQVCSSLLVERRAAERLGILDFSAALHVQPVANSSNAVNLYTAVDRGRNYRIGRMDFTGNRHLSDAIVRSNLLLDEGQPLDQLLLRKSAGRINQMGAFEPIAADGIAIHTNESTGLADISIHLKERKRGAWNISGPVGPASFGGPLNGSLSARLPSWGRGLIELSSYTASLSLIAFANPLLPGLSIFKHSTLLPLLALSRPFVPGQGWKSGFSIVPQLGWRATGLIYATSQIQHRLDPLLAGDRGLVSELPVAVDGPNSSGTMFCEPPAQRLASLRIAASLSLRLLGALTGL